MGVLAFDSGEESYISLQIVFIAAFMLLFVTTVVSQVCHTVIKVKNEFELENSSPVQLDGTQIVVSETWKKSLDATLSSNPLSKKFIKPPSKHKSTIVF
jgi:predicted PurR-regulated permease PerM